MDSDGTPTSAAAEVVPALGAGHRAAYQVLNASTAPVWLAMILAPSAKTTDRLVRLATPLLAGLGLAYTALLATATVTGDQRVDFRDPDSVRAALGDPTAFLAGWTHYLALDLVAGRLIWQEARAAGRTARLPLLLTWWFGPAGFTLFVARRRRWAAPHGGVAVGGAG